MKKIISVIVCMYTILILGGGVFAQLDYPHSEDTTILTNESSQVIGTVGEDGEPLRDGAAAIAEGLGGEEGGIYYEQIDSTQTAWDRTSTFISRLINYALAITGLVALVYLIYHGFIALTARDDSEQLEKGIGGIKYAAIALAGIGTAWFVISGILRFITLLTT